MSLFLYLLLYLNTCFHFRPKHSFIKNLQRNLKEKKEYSHENNEETSHAINHRIFVHPPSRKKFLKRCPIGNSILPPMRQTCRTFLHNHVHTHTHTHTCTRLTIKSEREGKADRKRRKVFCTRVKYFLKDS